MRKVLLLMPSSNLARVKTSSTATDGLQERIPSITTVSSSISLLLFFPGEINANYYFNHLLVILQSWLGVQVLYTFFSGTGATSSIPVPVELEQVLPIV